MQVRLEYIDKLSELKPTLENVELGTKGIKSTDVN